MARVAIAMDIGTSGLRAQLIDLSSREILSSAITTRHPLPGANVIDHLHFALEMGAETAQRILIQAVNRLIGELHIDTNTISRLAVCGNPTQLSLFQGIDIRDLAYAGQRKRENLGVVSPKQVGNTSLAMARELVLDVQKLELMSRLAEKLRPRHCMFAASDTFKKVFILELSYWTEGMPISMYRKLLKRYGFPDLPQSGAIPEIIRIAKRDIDGLGRTGLKIVPSIGNKAQARIEGCTACMNCVEHCPANALTFITEADSGTLMLEQSVCRGVTCRRCEQACPENVFTLAGFFDDTQEEDLSTWE